MAVWNRTHSPHRLDAGWPQKVYPEPKIGLNPLRAIFVQKPLMDFWEYQ